jgi:hypothetical protein
LLALAFYAGVLWNQVNNLEERLEKLETKESKSVDAIEVWVEKWMNCREKEAASKRPHRFLKETLECVEDVADPVQAGTGVASPPAAAQTP